MTQLTYRPRPSGPRADDPGVSRSQLLAVGLGALRAVLTGLALCMGAALAGWFLAEGGGHGQATDALRIGADIWLSGHGSTIDAAAGPLGITPLGVTVALLVIAHRCGRRCPEALPRATAAAVAPLVAVGCAVYVVLALLIAVFGARSGAEPRLLPALVGALLVSAAGFGTGVVRGAGVDEDLLGRVPERIRDVARIAVAGAGLLFAGGAVVVLIGLATSFTQAANVFTALDLTPGNALVLLVVCAAVVPNAALLGVAWLSGPGFAVGTGTSVTATAVTLGPLPAFPLLAALPGDGASPGWAGLVFAVPGLCALAAAGLAESRTPQERWELSAVRGLGGGLAGGVLIWLATCLAGGPMGTGRMADIGPDAGALLVTLVGAMALGGLVGASGVALSRRWRANP